MKKENTETSKNKLKLKKWNLTSDDIWYWYVSYYFKIELKKVAHILKYVLNDLKV